MQAVCWLLHPNASGHMVEINYADPVQLGTDLLYDRHMERLQRK